MGSDIYPLRVLLLTVSGWVNRHQADVIAYLVEENRVLKEQMRGRRLRLTDDQRRRLAAKAKLLGRKALDRVATIVTPDTLMRWHHRLIALKWTYETERVGRPGLMQAIAALIVRMARENSCWGYCRIQGELKAVGHRVASTTIANVLKANGITRRALRARLRNRLACASVPRVYKPAERSVQSSSLPQRVLHALAAQAHE